MSDTIRMFWDIDETLISSTPARMKKYREPTFTFEVEDQGFNTCVRPCAKELIDFSRELFGFENVFILTTATSSYANEVNKLAGWEFNPSNIIAREDMEKYTFRSAMLYASHTDYAAHPLAGPKNIIVDNLRAQDNEQKIFIMGINPFTNYLNVDHYYGENKGEESFIKLVKEFLEDRKKQLSK